VGSGAGKFDGTDDSVTVGSAASLMLSGPHTAEAWVKFDSFPTEWAPITVAQKYRYGLGYNNTSKKLRAHRNLGNTLYYLDFSVTLTTGVWYHVAQVFDGTNLKIYLNGELKAEGPGSTLSYSNTTDSAVMGRLWSSTDSEKLSGSLDEVALYKRALTTAEIATSYNKGLGRVALWHMDGDWTDASGNGRNGTAYNGAAFSTDARVGSKAGSFDGTDDYVAASGNYITTTANTFSIEIWVYPTASRTSTSESNSVSTGTSGQRYAVGPAHAGSNAGAGISVGTNGISVFEHGDNYLPSLLVYDVPLTGWNHVVVVYENKKPKLYLNGQYIKSGLTSTKTTVYPSLLFGNVSSYGAYQGLLDEAAIYNRALTDTEISTSYNTGLGRVALWHMDGDWTDASGNGNNGTANNGAAFSTDKRVGTQAGSFDGTDDYVSGSAADLPSGSSPRTLSAWVKVGSGTQSRAILQYGTGSASNFQLFLDSSNRAAVGSSNGSISGTSSLSDGQWHYVVGVYEGTGTNIAGIYVDGVLENSGTITAPDTTGDGFSIGAFLGGGGYLNGLIDEAVIYNHAITVDEINKTYQEGLGRIGLWHMDGDWTDASGNGRNGTAYNGAAFSTAARVGSQAGSFDGTDDYVAASSNYITTTTNTFSIEIWAYPTASRTSTSESNTGSTGTSGQRYAVAPAWGGSTGAGTGISVGTNGISVFEHGDNYMPSLLVHNATLSGWNHIVVVYENKQPKLYLNGQYIKSGLTSTKTTVYPSLLFGNGYSYGAYQGLLDEAAIYNRTLTNTEILNHYAAVVPYVQITSPAGSTNNNTPLLTYTILNGTATAVKVDGNTVSKVSGDSLDILSDGAHTVRVEAVNNAGTVGFAETTFTVDTVPPTLSINPVTSPTTTTTQTITGSMETGAAVAVSVNTAAIAGPVTYPTTTTWSCTLTNLAWGSNVITATASDAAGNSATAAATILQHKINISNVAVSSNVLDVSAPNTVSVFFTIDNPATMTVKIIPEKQGPTGTPVYQASQNCLAAGAYLFTWDGKDSTGTIVPDEAYLFILEAAVDGALAGTYSPDASGSSGTPGFSSSGDIDPFRNIPKTISYSVSTSSRCTLWFAVPYTLWETPSAWGYKILDNVPLTPGVNYTLDWDGRNRDGKVVVRPGMLVPGTSVPMDIYLVCTGTPLRENHIITSGDAPKITNVKTDPSEAQLSYGQFARIKYHLSRDANVTITLISPAGAETTLVNSQAQSAGDREFEWNGMDPADASGKKTVLSAEGSYTVRITAANPVTGSSAKAYAGLQMGF
jgi:flagellar hook assembly protein FlgD